MEPTALSFPTQTVAGGGRFRTNRMSNAIAPQGGELETPRNQMIAMVELCMASGSDWTNSEHHYSLWVIKYKHPTEYIPSLEISRGWRGFLRNYHQTLLLNSNILLWPQLKQDAGRVDSGLDRNSHSWVYSWGFVSFKPSSNVAVFQPGWVPGHSWLMLAWNRMNFGTGRDM